MDSKGDKWRDQEKAKHQKRFNASSDEKEVWDYLVMSVYYSMENNRKIKDVMTGMMEGTGRRGRPCREWMDDITDWCQTDVQQIESTGTRQRQVENDYKKCIGHLRALCPWIMMMMGV